MKKSEPKKSSLLKIGLYFLGCIIVSFTLGVILYGWNEMFVFWPPEYPRGRGALWGFAFGGLVGLIMLLIALLAEKLGKCVIKKQQRGTP